MFLFIRLCVKFFFCLDVRPFFLFLFQSRSRLFFLSFLIFFLFLSITFTINKLCSLACAELYAVTFSYISLSRMCVFDHCLQLLIAALYSSIPLNSIEYFVLFLSSRGNQRKKFSKFDGNWLLQANAFTREKIGVCKFQSKCIHKTHGDNDEKEGEETQKKPPKMYDMNASNVYLTRTYY